MNRSLRQFPGLLLISVLLLNGCAGTRGSHRKAALHTGYAYAYLSNRADKFRDKDFRKARKIDARARKHYIKAFQHGLMKLEQRYPGFSDTLAANPGRAMTWTARADVPLLYWTGAALGAAIGLSKDRPDMLIRLPQVGAMAFRVTELWPDYKGGAAFQLLMIYEASRSGLLGGSISLAKYYYEQALSFSKGHNASLFVSYAESICVQEQNRAEFVSMLEKALAIKAGGTENRLARKRARWLLRRTDDLFL